MVSCGWAAFRPVPLSSHPLWPTATDVDHNDGHWNLTWYLWESMPYISSKSHDIHLLGFLHLQPKRRRMCSVNFQRHTWNHLLIRNDWYLGFDISSVPNWFQVWFLLSFWCWSLPTYFVHFLFPPSLILTRRSISDVFRIQVVSNSDVRSPIITLGSTSFFHVRINNLYVVAVTKWVLAVYGSRRVNWLIDVWVNRTNANAALVFEFCYRFINICKAYFGKIDEESVKNNFVVIYELIDGQLLGDLLLSSQCYESTQSWPYRNKRFRIPPKQWNRHIENIYNDREHSLHKHRCCTFFPFSPISQCVASSHLRNRKNHQKSQVKQRALRVGDGRM